MYLEDHNNFVANAYFREIAEGEISIVRNQSVVLIW